MMTYSTGLRAFEWGITTSLGTLCNVYPKGRAEIPFAYISRRIIYIVIMLSFV